MKKFKISQIQFQAEATPNQNAQLLANLFKKAIKYKPNLICTPECSNIVTHDKKHLFQFATYQNNCPIIKVARIFAKQYKVNIHIGSLF